MPIIILTPNNSVMQSNRGKRAKHVFWKPYEYACRELYIEQNDDDTKGHHIEYMGFRKTVIEREQSYVDAKVRLS